MFVMHRKSIRHHSKSYGNQKNKENRQSQKFVGKVREESFDVIQTTSFSLQNFIYDPLNVFSKQMAAIRISII